jgi:hypothetical protein
LGVAREDRGGLSKTAQRSLGVKAGGDESRTNRVCEHCGKPIEFVRDMQPVSIALKRMAYFHKSCYKVG